MTDTIDRPGELIAESIEAAEKVLRPTVVEVKDPRDGTVALATIGSDGVRPVPESLIDQFRDKPLARTGTARLTRLDSFIAHTLRFASDDSAIFASDDPTAPKLTTVFDYHPTSPDRKAAQPGKHRALYAFPLSDEWQAWAKHDGKPMPMLDFAAFLEDRIVDVVADAKPSSDAAKDFIKKTGGNIASPSKLIEIARGLQVNEASVLRETRNLSSGEAEVVFQSEHTDAAGNKLTLPNLFMVCVPVFARSPVFYQILARFRYRKNGGGLVFWYELWRPDLVFEQAFTEACDKAVSETKLPLFVGNPES